MFGKKSNDNGEKLYRYSIRKYHFGAASVAVAALMFFANGAVKADTLSVSPVTANTEKVNAGVTGLTEGVPPKENLIEKSKEVEGDKTTVAQKPVDKSPLVQAISELQAAIAKADEESLLSLSNQLSQLTDENKRLLDGENVSKEALTSLVSRVQSLTEQVRQLKSKTEDKTSNKEDRADSKAQNTKELKVSDKAVIPTNQNEEIKAVQKDENKGEGTANKDKLEALSKSLITYLDTAKKIERPETKKLLEGVEEIVRSVENGLVNPKLTTSEIEELMKQGKQAEKKLVLAVTREHSGKRDTRNGNKMLPESYFRAPNTREGANTEFGNAYTAWMITNDDFRRFQSAAINDPNYYGYNYPVGTFLYNSNNAENSPINNNNMQGPQRIAWTRNRVYVQVNRVSGNEQSGYEFNWKIQFNNGREPHQKPFYYFTLPDGHNFSSSVVLKENDSQIATGTIDDVLQKSKGLLNGKMGTTEGVNGGEYYKGTGLINGHPYIQAPIRTLEDFVKNSTNYYFNRSGVNGDIIQKSDFLFENIRNSTKNIIAIQPQGRNSGGFNHSYSFEFTTHSNSGDAPYYVAGVKTYETTLGLTQHRSYSQWGTLKDAYTIKTDSFTNGDFKKKTFLKGTQLGVIESDSFSFNSTNAATSAIGDRFIDAGLVLRNNATGRDERPQKGKLLLKVTPTATLNGSQYSHIHNLYNPNDSSDWATNSTDRTKGGHLAYLEGTYNGSTIKLPFSFNIVTQSDIFEPVKNETKENQARKTTETLGNAADFISGYNNVSNRIPDLFTNWSEGNTDTLRRIFKGGSDRFPGSSDDIKNRAIKNVEWADGNSNLTGEKIVPVKVRYTPQGAQPYEETKYVTLPPELNNLSIGQVLTEAQKQKIIELAESTFDADSASFDGNTAKVGVKKQVKITYMDNEKNALTGNKDDSVRYVDFHFTNLTVPDSNKPVVTMNGRTLTTNADENQFIIYRGAAFNPTFNVTDESRIGSLMVRNLPKGVYFNKVDNVDKARVGTSTTLNHTISGDDSNKVADDATLGEQIALVEASDQYGNSETYKFKYRIVDIQAKNSTTENRALGSTLGNPHDHFKVAESDTAANDKYYPDRMQFKWNEFDSRNVRFTEVPDNTKLNEVGTIAKYIATAVFPSTVNTKSIDGVNYTIYTPAKKAVPMTFNVTDNVAPTVMLSGTTLTDDASNKTVHLFRGSSLELPLTYYDNVATGRVNISYKNDGGLPKGVWFNENANANSNFNISQDGKTETKKGSYTVRGNVSNAAILGERTVTLKVSDSTDGSVDRGNKKEVKFNIRTYDVEPNSIKVTVDKGTTLSVQNAKDAVIKVNGALDLPEGTTYEWVDSNGRNQTITPTTAGVQNYKVKVTLPSSESGNNSLSRSSKIVNVSVNVRPEAPTITTEEKYKGTLVSTERSISGTGQPGAKVKITLQDGTTVREVNVENNGKWQYNLAANEKLTLNDKDSTVKASNPISVKQVVDNIESVSKTVNVQMGRAISVSTPVKAGRDITVKLPHDTALFYLQVINGSSTVQYDVKLVDGNWKILNEDKVGTTELKVSAGDNISEKVFTIHIKDSNKKENIPFRINDDTTIQVRAHYVNNKNNPANPTNDGGWAVASRATNTDPVISVANQNASYISDGTLTKDKLKTFVNVTDVEDDDNKTVGNSARENLDVTVTKNGQSVDLTNGKALKQGTYNLTYTTTDAAGVRVTKNHSIIVNYIAKAKPTINFIQGENVSDALKRSMLQLQDGDDVINVPNDASVELTNFDINAPSDNKTTQATVVLSNGTRLAPVTLNYNVMKKFETVTKVYDFAGEGRNDSPASYYLNPGGLPGGMSWVVKRGNEAEKNADTNDNMKNMLKADGVGTTNYKFGAKYPRGRFTNNPTNDADKLSYMSAFTHEVFDIADSKNVSVSQGTTLSAEQAKAAVKNATGSDTLPTGTRYEWVGNKVANTSGKQTFQVKVTLPPSQTGDNLPAATQATPSKTINVTVNVTPPKPTFDSNKVTSTSRTITGTLGGLNANSSNTVVSVALNDGTNRVLTSENNGGVRINGNTWTATLPDDVKLRTSVAKNGETTQPRGLTVTTKIKGSTTADDISVTSDVKAVEMGDYSVNATIAGSKHIDVKVPHDAKRMELRFHNSTESSNTPKSIVLVRGADGTWHTDATRADNTAVTNANGYVGRISSTVSTTNPAENNIRIELNEQSGTAKLHIKEESASGDNTESYGSGLGLRVYNQSEAGQAPSATGKWKVASVTNTKPTLSYKGTEASRVDARKVFPSGTSITKAILEDLVTVGDTEDKVTNEADKPYGTPTIKIVSGLTETPGKATASGSYAVVLKAVDSQGKESDPLTVYVGVVSTELKYQPQLNGKDLGTAKDIPVSGGEHAQGEVVNYTPEAVTVDNKVYVPVTTEGHNVTLTDQPQTVKVEYVEKPSTSTLTFTVGTQNPQTGNVEVTVDGVPEGTKVKLPGISSEKVVTGGKVELTNSELPENPTTGKGIAQEDGKLPKEGTSDITIPGKLTSAKGEPAREFEVTIPLPIVVPDPEHLTPKEIEKLVDKVKESNPNTIVTADDKGNVTVTDKTTGESVLIPVKDLTVKDFEPVKPSEKVPVKDKSHLTPEEKKQVADKVKDKNPGKEVTVGDDGTATVKDPTTGISHTIPGTELVNQDFELVKPTDKVPVKDPSNLTKEEQDKVKKAVEKANPGKDVTVDSKGNAIVKDPRTKISHEIPNKDLVMVTGKGDSTKLDLPSFIITKWVDENGNELKSADAKAPTVLGKANEAFEHGEIEGYVFVRTETKGDVVTHVFRKVSPVRPIGDGQQRPATPSDVTNSRPDTANPAEVPATQPAEQPSQTVEVPAQLPNEVSETDSSVSQPQAVLPNTGTQEDRATGALGALSLLGAFGLLFAKKKKDDEEEA